MLRLAAVATIVLLSITQAHAIQCGQTANRAGCVGPNGAAGYNKNTGQAGTYNRNTGLVRTTQPYYRGGGAYYGGGGAYHGYGYGYPAPVAVPVPVPAVPVPACGYVNGYYVCR